LGVRLDREVIEHTLSWPFLPVRQTMAGVWIFATDARKLFAEVDLDVVACIERLFVKSNMIGVLSDVWAVEKSVDLLLWSTRNEESHVSCLDSFETEL